MRSKPSLPDEQGAPKKLVRCPFKTALHFIKDKCGNTFIQNRFGKGYNQVIILPDAALELMVMTSYGRRSSTNRFEQKFCGYGHFLRNEHGHILIIVKHFIEIQTFNGNTDRKTSRNTSQKNPGMEYFDYCREEFLKTEVAYNTDAYGKEIDPFLSYCGPSELVLMGHTLPDHGVYYSEHDITGGSESTVPSYPVCSFVCDPIQKRMISCIGESYDEAEIIVLSRAEPHGDEYSDDDRLIPPTDEIVRLANRCLHNDGYSGSIRLRERIDGRADLSIDLVIPKPEENTRECKNSRKILAHFSKTNFNLRKKSSIIRK